MIRENLVELIDDIDDKIFFLRQKLNRSISDLNTKSIYESSKSIISLILRREDLMSLEETAQEKTIESHIENDKVEIELAYQYGNLPKAHHLEDELNQLETYHANHPEDHHDPTSLELYCNNNPSAPECLVYDD